MHVLIVGFGATGQRLATNLVAQGHQVTALSRNPVPYAHIVTMAQSVHTADLNDISPIDWVYIILSADERTASSYKSIFIDSISPLRHALASHPIQRVVFISSTSVYGRGQGEWIDEHSPLQPDTATAQVLAQAEQQWRATWQDKLVIIRPSGIYAQDRLRLIRWVQQQQPVSTNQWTNRIHIDDLARFLAHLTQLEKWLPIYIASDNCPALQHEVLYYIASELGLATPDCIPSLITGKRLDSALMHQTGYALIYPDFRIGYGKILTDLSMKNSLD